MTDTVVEVWIDFTYKEHSFTIHNPLGEYWLSVENPECPEAILTEVMEHVELFIYPG